MEDLILKIKDEDNAYICSSKYKIDTKKYANGKCIVVKDIETMGELIHFCLKNYYNVEIPKEYKVTPIYILMFSTGDFDPEDRGRSIIHSHVVCSSKDEDEIIKEFEKMKKLTGKKNHIPLAKREFCWHTEDFAVNQIIHGYSIDKDYIIEKIK